MNPETYTVGPGTLTIGADTDLTTFQNQVTACRLVPSIDRGDSIPVLSGGEARGERTVTYSLDGTMLQDVSAAVNTSRTAWLYEHDGELHPFTFRPNNGGRTITGTLEVAAIEIGGDARSRPTSDFSFPCEGKPDLAEPVA